MSQKLPCIDCILLAICKSIYIEELKKQCEAYNNPSCHYSSKMTKYRAIGELLYQKKCNELSQYTNYSSGALITERVFSFHEYVTYGVILNE